MLFFDRLKTLSIKEARIQLSKIMGVGRKVIDNYCLIILSVYLGC
jgi:3-methyladenine DNA glycosylase/8-oxoguanine DNA glycosylase